VKWYDDLCIGKDLGISSCGPTRYYSNIYLEGAEENHEEPDSG
jgi:hypothetical protein